MKLIAHLNNLLFENEAIYVGWYQAKHLRPYGLILPKHQHAYQMRITPLPRRPQSYFQEFVDDEIQQQRVEKAQYVMLL